jgi:hypothetical protein
VRPADATPRPPDVLEVISPLPAGTRTKDDIDRQLHEALDAPDYMVRGAVTGPVATVLLGKGP